uniref:Retrovirus-related Pol polyprotein from transposon TNT 1-94-like beta-barrel domain-containing protein n=1 Tax=Leersia perrieri TaxID=77586 RepID=A0A0D9Y0E2_9ORYZ
MATRPAAAAAATEEVVMKLTEVYPTGEDSELFDAIRKRNSAAIASLLDPSVELPIKDSSNADDAVWYLNVTDKAHHITGNLNLLADLMPVHDRWVRIQGSPVSPPMQVFARGSVNHKGFVLQDVWYVPECKVNAVSAQELGELGLQIIVSKAKGTFEVMDCDGVLFGKGRRINRLFELEFLNTISGEVPWYIASNATQHMTGDMFLLTEFTSTRPGLPVRTHTGTLLQVQGKGFLRTKHLAVPEVSYVPGLTENIISLNQLTDSGLDDIFLPDVCLVVRRNDAQEIVGMASHSGGQMYRINYLRIAPN